MHKILEHVLLSLQKQYPEGHFLVFLLGKDDAFRLDFSNLLVWEQWRVIIETRPAWVNPNVLMGLIVSHVALAFCDYSRCISQPLHNYPYKFVKLLRHEPGVVCEERKQIIKDFLEAPGIVIGNSLET